MAERAVETFDVRVERGADDYVVVADSSYGGTYRTRFRDEIDRADIVRFQRALRLGVGRDIGVNDPDPGRHEDVAEIARRLGHRLFGALFVGELRLSTARSPKASREK